MLLMLIASAWLEPHPAACRQRAVRLVRRGNGQLSAEATAGRKVADSLAGQAVNGHSSGGIEQIVADLHLRRDNRHAGPAQLRDVRRHSLTAEPEQGVESGDRQAGCSAPGGAAPGPALSPGQSAGTGPPSARLHRRDECGLPGGNERLPVQPVNPVSNYRRSRNVCR